MNKLLIVLFGVIVCFNVDGSARDPYKQALYELLGKGESALILNKFRNAQVKSATVSLARALDRSSQTLLPKIKELLPKIFRGNSNAFFVQSRDDFVFLQDLHYYSERNNALLPFIKKAFDTCLKTHTDQEIDRGLYGRWSRFPKKNVIDTYPSTFKKGSIEEAVLGPLLNPGKITKKEYDKQLKTYYTSIFNSLKFFLDHPSEVLFPGLLKVLHVNSENIFVVTEIKEKFEVLLEALEDEDDGDSVSFSTFLKPDEKRDLAVLKAFWKASIDDAGLVVFVEKGHANFKKCYGYSAPIRALQLKEGLTLGMFADKNKNSEAAKLCHKLEPAPTSFFLKAAVVGILSGIGYFAYKKYKDKKNSGVLGSAVDLSSIKP